MFPGLYINLNLGTEKGDGGTQGWVVNHVGFIVDNVQARAAQWKAAGVPVLPGNNNRLDQAFVETPDGVRIEILEDKTPDFPGKFRRPARPILRRAHGENSADECRRNPD
jgi:hypothetical protein